MEKYYIRIKSHRFVENKEGCFINRITTVKEYRIETNNNSQDFILEILERGIDKEASEIDITICRKEE